MKPKPSRTFVYLTLIMVFLLVLGLVVVGMLIASNRPQAEEFDQTPTILIAMNETTAFHAIQTETAKAELALTTYIADASPTFAANNPCPFFYPTPPYDPELFAVRCKEMMGLITGGGPTQYAIFYMTETALVADYQTSQSYTRTPTPTVTLTISPTALAQPAASCAFSWAHRDLPDVAVLAQTTLDKTDIPQTTVRADAYGEECVSSTSQVAGFSAMTTDFYLTVEFTDLTNQAALIDYITTVYTALLALPSESLPATQGYLDITFTSGGTTQHLRTMFASIKAALKQQLTGAAFFEALGGLE